jgi:hypothetical protein
LLDIFFVGRQNLSPRTRYSHIALNEPARTELDNRPHSVCFLLLFLLLATFHHMRIKHSTLRINPMHHPHTPLQHATTSPLTRYTDAEWPSTWAAT